MPTKMSQLITLYDIPSAKKPKPWSGNIWKIRFVLNYKKIPYRTVWVEFPNIKDVCKKIGIPATGKEKDGSPMYTLPAIFDPSTNTASSESILIAEYLDDRYPDTPKVFPAGTRPLQSAFIDALRSAMIPLFQFSIPAGYQILNPESKEYYRQRMEGYTGITLEMMTPTGAARDQEWAKVKAGFDKVHGWLEEGKRDGPWFLGKDPTFVDFALGAALVRLRQCFGGDSPEWKDITSWNGDRWGVFMEGLREYETVV